MSNSENLFSGENIKKITLEIFETKYPNIKKKMNVLNNEGYISCEIKGTQIGKKEGNIFVLNDECSDEELLGIEKSLKPIILIKKNIRLHVADLTKIKKSRK